MATSKKNHWAKNIITRGNMNISAITRGFILPYFRFEIRKKGGGSDQYGEGLRELQHELKKLTGVTEEEVDYIAVFVDWNKDVDKYGKEIYAELIEKKITAQLLKHTNEKYKINVELIKE